MIRVGVIGAAGRMGRLVCRAVAEDPDLLLSAAINPGHDGEDLGGLVGVPNLHVRMSGELDTLLQAEVEVAVDFTRPDVVMDDVRWAIEHAVYIVVGTTGIGPEDLGEIRELLRREGDEYNVVVAPNFAIGAVLMQRFAETAARYLPAAEIVELHHEGKLDAPSGTAIATARRIARARARAGVDASPQTPPSESVAGVRGGTVEGVRVHSVRLPGLVAHQEVILGGLGQTLTIRHDAPLRESYMPGVVLATKMVFERPGLTVGLEPLLGLEPLDAG